MSRPVLVLLAVLALLVAFALGQDRGIRLGVQEATALCWVPPPAGVRVPG